MSIYEITKLDLPPNQKLSLYSSLPFLRSPSKVGLQVIFRNSKLPNFQAFRLVVHLFYISVISDMHSSCTHLFRPHKKTGIKETKRPYSISQEKQNKKTSEKDKKKDKNSKRKITKTPKKTQKKTLKTFTKDQYYFSLKFMTIIVLFF